MTEEEKKEADRIEREKDAAIKEKYGTVLKINIWDEGVLRQAYIKKPNRYQISPVLATIDRDPVFAYELLWNSCKIDELTDPKIFADDDLFLNAMKELDKITPAKKKNSTIL
jgi:hypothetical protein